MPSKTLAFLQKIFHPVLRIFGMSAEPEDTREFPDGTMTVVAWARDLVSLHESPKHRPRIQGLHVVRIRRYKEPNGSRHEYLVAEIATPGSERRYLCIERSLEDLTPPPESSSAKKEVFHAVSNGSSQSSLALSSSLDAFDSVKIIEKLPRDSCIDRLDCENLPQPITILDLALVAQLVHNNSDKYRLISRQCFWYADTISAVLETCFPEIKIVNRPDKGHHTENGEDGDYDENSGKFMGFPFHRRRQDVVDEIVGVFQQRKADITTSVCFFDLY